MAGRPGHVITQVVAATAASTVLFVTAHGKRGFSAHTNGFAANDYGEHSPGGYTLLACAACEIVLTAFFVFVILGATDERAPEGFAPIAIGLALTLIHLVSIPVTNTSVNPARTRQPPCGVGVMEPYSSWVAFGFRALGVSHLHGEGVQPQPGQVRVPVRTDFYGPR